MGMDYIEKLAKDAGQDFRMLDPVNYIRLGRTDLYLQRHFVERLCENTVVMTDMAKTMGRYERA